MRVIIAGSRSIFNMGLLESAIKDSGFLITEVVCGDAPGVDKLGELWAKKQYPGIPVTHFPADWKNLDVEPCVIRHNANGAYNAAAGGLRNEAMAQYADALILIWDGKSTGSRDMLNRAKRHGLNYYVLQPEKL